MSLPHQIGLGRESQRRPDSDQAAEAHARGRGHWALGRIEWNRGNVAGLVAAIALVVAVLAGVVAWGIGVASTDPSTPRSTANAPTSPLARGDEAATSELDCAGMYNTNGRDVVARALRAAEGDGPAYVIGPEYGDRHVGYFFDFEVFGEARGSISVRHADDEDKFLVCDFYDVQVRTP
jgi:hypothetical protein